MRRDPFNNQHISRNTEPAPTTPFESRVPAKPTVKLVAAIHFKFEITQSLNVGLPSHSEDCEPFLVGPREGVDSEFLAGFESLAVIHVIKLGMKE